MKKPLMLALVFWGTAGTVATTAQQRDSVRTTGADTLAERQIEAVRVEAQRRREVGSVRLGQQQLAREMASDLRDLVRYMPGVGISYSGARGGNRGFAMRGVEANRVAISVDGMPQPEVHENLVFSAYGLSNASRIEFDPYFVSAIDLQKGASSFASGSGALGGAVNYQTKSAADILRPARQYGATVQTSYNGKDRMRMYLAGAAARKGKWEGLLLFADRRGSEIRNFGHGSLSRNVTSTQVDPMGYRQQTFLGKAAFAPSAIHRLEMAYYLINKKTDAEIWSQEPLDIFTSADKPYYFSHDQSLSHSYTLGYAFRPQGHWLAHAELRGNIQQTFLDAATWSEYYRPNFDGMGGYELIYEGRRDKYRGQEVTDRTVRADLKFGDLKTTWAGLHRFSLSAGLAGKHNDSRNVDVENPFASNKADGYTVRMGRRYAFGEAMGRFVHAYAFQRPIARTNLSASIADNIQLRPDLTLTLGARYDRFRSRDQDWTRGSDAYYMDYLLRNLQDVDMNQAPISDVDHGLSYLATLHYQLGNALNLGYKFSTGYRVPTTEERYFQYFSSWPSFLVLANRGLKAETSQNHELEIAGSGRFGVYQINVYRSGYRDFIDIDRGTVAVSNPLDNSSKSLSYVRNVNRRSARLWGADAKLHLRLAELHESLGGFGIHAAASYAKGETSHGTSMLGTQPLTALAGLEYSSATEKWTANLVANCFGAKKRDETRFVESTARKEIQRQFPAMFLADGYSIDLYGSARLAERLTLRAGLYNILDAQYWRWDDLRQLTNPALLPHIENFFREGNRTIARFSQPRRYVSISVECRI